MHTSYSALDTYKTCPLKYKYQEIDKIKTPKRVELVFGTVIHSALKYMFERGPLYPSFDEITDFYVKKWNEASENIEWTQPGKKESLQKIYYDEGLKLLDNFYKKNKPWNFNTVELESRFVITIKDEKSDESHTIAGIMDRLDKNPETNEYEIIDYKTGKKMPSQEILESNLQLGLYALALVARWPDLNPKNIKTSLYFLKHNEKVSSMHSPQKLDSIKDQVIKSICEIEEKKESNLFPPTPGPLCNYCGYRKICPMWAHEYKKDTAEKSEEDISAAIVEFFEIKEKEEKNKKRLAELRDTILSYMEKENLQRVFGSYGYITKNLQERFSYSMEKLKPVLENIGKWQDILVPDSKKIAEILPTLSDEDKEKIEEIKEKKVFTVLKQSKK